MLFLDDKKNCQVFLLTMLNIQDSFKYVLDVGELFFLEDERRFGVPDAVTKPNEKILVLDKNNLIELPASISKLVLKLKDRITELPAEIGDLRELRWLIVNDSHLVGLPTSIRGLTKLERLYLDANKLAELPAEIGDLRELRELRVSHNHLVGLPTSVQSLTKLERLYLDGNKLTELPAEIGDLRELRELRVSNNQLVGLPTSIQRLTKLERLDLVGNKLTALPAEIGDLRELKMLSVIRNPLALDGIRLALKLRKKGVLVVGVEGEHNGLFSYSEVRKKTEIKFQYLSGKGKSGLLSVIGGFANLRV